jgi:enterochelin esterase family protein
MKKLFIVIVLTAGLAHAQAPTGSVTPVDGSVPAPSNVANAQYPRINPDHTVTFRIQAPAAEKVSLSSGLGFGTYDLVKGDDGAWTVTTKPLDPGFYYYSVVVDGFSSDDPGTKPAFGSGRWGSALEVPGDESDFFAIKDVPHGVLREQWYYSKAANPPAWRHIYIYTPPGYDTSTARYPVLYLQHGAGENETSWANQGHENFIMDNLIAAGKTKPMIIVNENGTTGTTGGGRGNRGGPPQAGRGNAVPPPGAGPAGQPGAAGGRGAGAGRSARNFMDNPYTEFGNIMIQNLIPYIDANFRTIADRDHRAIAGLSMGGAEAIKLGTDHLDTFSYIGLFSPAIGDLDPAKDYGGKFANAAAMNRQLHLLWIGIGTQDPFHDGVKTSHENLDKVGVKNVWVETGGGHVWTNWRKYMTDFAPRLFQ